MLQSDSTKMSDIYRIWKDLIYNVTHIIDDNQIITPYHIVTFAWYIVYCEAKL